VHGGGGTMRAGVVEDGARVGVWAEFVDEGPGIADHQQAMREGYSTGGGLGLGLGGARRLVSEFDLRSAPGEGTRVRVVAWR
jgi:serine/threonine-protein kinase RsbT